MLTRLLLPATLTGWLVASAAAQEHPQQLLKQPWVKSAWSAAMKGEKFKRWDSWIPELGGVGSAPVARRDAAGRDWLVAELCQPHNCADNKLIVVIDRTDNRIWALQLTQSPASRRYFGKPDTAVRAVIEAARKGDLSTVSLASAPAAASSPPGASAQNGSIEGALSFPSDFIPDDIAVCAEEIGSKIQHCNARKTRRGAAVRYSLSVPAGEYHVFARSQEMAGKKAYYSQFVTCGLMASCKSHAPIPVKVGAGAKVTAVNPQDWYAP